MFDWGTQCVEGRKLCYDLPGQDPFVEPFQQVGPGSSASVQHVDSMHCLLTVQTGAPRSPITRAVQAATAVAVGGIPIPKRVITKPQSYRSLSILHACCCTPSHTCPPHCFGKSWIALHSACMLLDTFPSCAQRCLLKLKLTEVLAHALHHVSGIQQNLYIRCLFPMTIICCWKQPALQP